MRLIDADALLEKSWDVDCRVGYVQVVDVGDILDAPTITIPQWTPTSESLPKNDDWVIVTILDERGDTPFRYTDFGWYLEAAKCWIIDAEQRTDVIAWMSLPRPWKEGIAC